jgi:hypothetical protein
MPLAQTHFKRMLGKYEELVRMGRFDQLDHEIYNQTWMPDPGLLTSDEMMAVGPLIVDFELAVADRDRPRAELALERAWDWLRRRGPAAM